MSDLPRWRPLGRAEVDALGAMVAQQLGQWLAQWLPDPREVTAAVHSLPTGVTSEVPRDAWRLTPWQRVALHPALLARAAARALALPSGGDHDAETSAVLATLAQEMEQDLCALLAPVGGGDAGPAAVTWAHGGYRFEFDLLGLGAAVTCWVACEYLWAKAVPTGRLVHVGNPIPVLEALAMRTVAVDVRLGDCRLRASDVWGLQCGDVLVTTRALAEPVALELMGAHGRRAVVARGQLGHHGTRMALNITALGAGV